MVGRFFKDLLKGPYPGLALAVGNLVYSAIRNDWKPWPVFVVGAFWAIASLWIRNWILEQARRPKLQLVFRPDIGEPYMIEKRTDANHITRVYRVGIANESETTVEDVAVLLKSFSPNEQEVRLLHELRR